MRLRERPDDAQLPSPEGDSGNLLGTMRLDANRFLAAGDEAINRALAGSNSEAFLRAGRQQGGE